MFIIYTKHSKCEILKSTVEINLDSSFRFMQQCGLELWPQQQYGKWSYLNDSIIIAKNSNSVIWKFKVVSDSVLELQTNAFINPKYIKE